MGTEMKPCGSTIKSAVKQFLQPVYANLKQK